MLEEDFKESSSDQSLDKKLLSNEEFSKPKSTTEECVTISIATEMKTVRTSER